VTGLIVRLVSHGDLRPGVRHGCPDGTSREVPSWIDRTAEPGMNVSRRDLLTGAAASLLTGASSMAMTRTGARARGGPAIPAPGTVHLTRAGFAEHVGTDFRVRIGALQSAALRLDSVLDLPPSPPRTGDAAAGREGFSLLFSGLTRQRFPQGTYTVEHGGLGSFPLFLVPVGSGASGSAYEAVVNRLWP
jgi:hypothetical protein